MSPDTYPQKLRLLPPSPTNQRNSEGSFVKLQDGRLLFAYSRFTGGGRDDSPSDLAVISSDDLGATWTEPQILLPNEGSLNTMSVSFLRLSSGEIGLFYIVRDEDENTQHTRYCLRLSSDEAATWQGPIVCTGAPSYYVVNNDRVVQLASGRLLVPAADHSFFDGSHIGVGRPLCFLSDDLGRTWRGTSYVALPEGVEPFHLQEPGVVELRDGRLMMLCRTTLGCHYRSWSEDGGETWSVAEPTELIAPCSPSSCKRLPTTGDLLIVYNDHRDIPEALRGRRTPLVTAISRDEGKTWGNYRVLEDDPAGWYCYIAIHCEGDMVLLAYCAGNSTIGGLSLTQITRLPVEWLYEA